MSEDLLKSVSISLQSPKDPLVSLLPKPILALKLVFFPKRLRLGGNLKRFNLLYTQRDSYDREITCLVVEQSIINACLSIY